MRRKCLRLTGYKVDFSIALLGLPVIKSKPGDCLSVGFYFYPIPKFLKKMTNQRKTPSKNIAAIPGNSKVMSCPKCGYEQDQSEECIKCGIIIRKFIKNQQVTSELSEDDDAVLSPETIQKKNLATICMLISATLIVISFFMKDRLPDPDKILEELRFFPRQTQPDRSSFTTRVKGVNYTILPLHNYELYGLVVSLYDSTGWWDITHRFLWKDHINIKDICVVYGANARSGVYRDMRWKNGSWTCYCKPKRKLQATFFKNCFSNNHLLSEKKDVKKAIMNAERGDQIYLKGYLVSYAHKGGARGTSTSRNDTGDHACETIYVEDFRILKKSNRFWRFLFSLSVFLFGVSIVALTIFFVKEIRGAQNMGDRENAGMVIRQSIDAIRRPENRYKVKLIGQLLFLLLLLYLFVSVY